MAVDEFEKLLPFKWRDLELPVTNIRLSLDHDLVEHKYWGVDGGRIEATGVAPIRISASIPLLNTIFPAKTEGWKQGGLYPQALRRLFVEFGKKTNGLLQHPEFGQIACKADKIECLLASDRRGHAQIEASWVQTAPEDVVERPRLSGVAEIQSAAQTLDASDADLRSLAPTIPKFETTFADFARDIAAVGDQVAILQQRSAGKIDAIVYRAKQVQQSIDRARTPLTWPATREIEVIKAAAQGLREKLLEAGKSIGVWTVAYDTTLAGVQAQLPANTGMGDVIRLNPRLVSGPIVPSGTGVRYYLAA